jgi:sec-independent protein translocase protein TatB
MFELSLVELLCIAVVGIVVLGPEDIPKVIAAIMRLFAQVKSMMRELRSQLDEVTRDAGIEEFKGEFDAATGEILDGNGQWQKTYDLDDFLKDDEKKKDGAHE